MIAEELNIHGLEHDLDGVYGYYGKGFIALNHTLKGEIKNFTCIHELGQALFHLYGLTSKSYRVTK